MVDRTLKSNYCYYCYWSFIRIWGHLWSPIRVVFHQGHLWSFIRVVFHEGDVSVSSGWSFIRMVSHHGGLSVSSWWSLIRMVPHHGGPSSGYVSTGWSLSFIRVVVFHQDGVSSGWAFMKVVSLQGGLSISLGWSFIKGCIVYFITVPVGL